MGEPGTAKLKVHEGAKPSPSEQIVAAAAKSVTVTDAAGHVITLRKPPILAEFRLVEALGPAASNQAYMSMVLPLLFVSAIDGDPVTMPMKKSEVEALIVRLDHGGIDAVMEGALEHFGRSSIDPEEDAAAVKK